MFYVYISVLCCCYFLVWASPEINDDWWLIDDKLWSKCPSVFPGIKFSSVFQLPFENLWSSAIWHAATGETLYFLVIGLLAGYTLTTMMTDILCLVISVSVFVFFFNAGGTQRSWAGGSPSHSRGRVQFDNGDWPGAWRHVQVHHRGCDERQDVAGLGRWRRCPPNNDRSVETDHRANSSALRGAATNRQRLHTNYRASSLAPTTAGGSHRPPAPCPTGTGKIQTRHQWPAAYASVAGHTGMHAHQVSTGQNVQHLTGCHHVHRKLQEDSI